MIIYEENSMKVVIFDKEKQLSDTDFEGHVQIVTELDSLTGADSVEQDSLILLTLLDEESLKSIASRFKDTLWKLFLHEDFKSSSCEDTFGEDVVIEYFSNLEEVSVIQGQSDETALRSRGVDLSTEANYDIPENKKLQEAVDNVYKLKEFSMTNSNDDDDSGLNFNMPEEEAEATKHDISLELGDSDDEDSLDSEDSSQDVDDGALDLGEMSSSNISLSESDDDLDNGESAPADEGLDLGGLDDNDLSLSAEDDEIQNSTSEEGNANDLDLSMGESSDLSLSEEGDEIENADPEAPSAGDLDLDATTATTEESDSLDDSLDDELADDDLSLSADDLDSDMSDEMGDLDGLDDLDDDLNSLDDLDADSLDDESIGEDTGKTVVATLTNTSLDLDADDVDICESDSLDESFEEDQPNSVGTGTFKTKLNIMLGDQTETITSTTDNILAASEDETQAIDMPNELREVEHEVPATATVNQKTVETPADPGQLLTSLSSNELLDLRVTLQELKDDRSVLLDKINGLEEENRNSKQDNLNHKADTDELKIEISILKKRHLAELEDMKHQLNVATEKRDILDAKNKSYQKEMERLGHKIRVDFGQIKQREKDLESQLELVTMDADSKVKGRDLKILELKRKIDSLEFNMENVSIKERQSRKDRTVLEDKLNKVVGTLRNSLNFLEEEIDIEELTKDLDL